MRITALAVLTLFVKNAVTGKIVTPVFQTLKYKEVGVLATIICSMTNLSRNVNIVMICVRSVLELARLNVCSVLLG